MPQLSVRGGAGLAIEGGAEYEAFKAVDAAGAASYADARQRFLVQAWSISLPLVQLETWGPARAAHVDGDLYGLSALAVEYLAGQAGAPSIQQYWSALATAPSWQAAFQSTFGMTVGDFYGRFETYRQTQLAPPPPMLTFVGPAPLSTLAGFPPGGTLYELHLIGSTGQLASTAVKVVSAAGAVVSSSWGLQGPERLFVYLSPGTPSGSYSVVLTLPGGQTLSATFSHPGG